MRSPRELAAGQVLPFPHPQSSPLESSPWNTDLCWVLSDHHRWFRDLSLFCTCVINTAKIGGAMVLFVWCSQPAWPPIGVLSHLRAAGDGCSTGLMVWHVVWCMLRRAGINLIPLMHWWTLYRLVMWGTEGLNQPITEHSISVIIQWLRSWPQFKNTFALWEIALFVSGQTHLWTDPLGHPKLSFLHHLFVVCSHLNCWFWWYMVLLIDKQASVCGVNVSL